MTDIYSEIEQRLQDLRSRMEEHPELAAELTSVAASLEVLIAGLREERRETARRLRLLENNQRTLDVHVAAIENSLIFRFLRTVGKPLLDWKARLSRSRQSATEADPVYEAWLQRQQSETGFARLAWQPLISIAMAVQDAREEGLRQTVESVLRQSYANWELCLYATGSNPAPVRDYLQGLATAEPRVRICEGGPGAEERGEYILLLRQHDLLSPNALQRVAEGLQNGPADLLYTDEDRLNSEGRHTQPVFKPDWSPDLLLSCPYMGHLMVFSREALHRAGGFRAGFEGAEEYDLALRLSDGEPAIRHIPHVLYHARMEPEASAAHAAGRRALEDAILRRHWAAAVENGPAPGRYRIRRQFSQQPIVSLIVCSRSPALLSKCLQGLRQRTGYARREVIVVQHLTGPADAAMERIVAQYGAARVPYSGAFDFSRMNNLGAKAATGEILVFLNDDVEPLADSWLTDLVEQAQRPEVGAAGARLLYPSGSLQHGGITIGIGDGCGHVGRGAYAWRYWPWLDVTRNVSAVTGACLAVRSQVFQEVGGFSERFPVNYNDADLCMRIGRAGYRIVYVATAVLRHHECQTRVGGVAFAERQQWYSCWADELDAGDPFYNPNLTRMREDASLRGDE